MGTVEVKEGEAPVFSAGGDFVVTKQNGRVFVTPLTSMFTESGNLGEEKWAEAHDKVSFEIINILAKDKEPKKFTVRNPEAEHQEFLRQQREREREEREERERETQFRSEIYRKYAMTKDLKYKVASFLIELRARHGLGQGELAEILGVSRVTIRNYEAAKSNIRFCNFWAIVTSNMVSTNELDELFFNNEADSEQA